MDSKVIAPSSVTARVNSLRTKASPWSASSFSARTSTGTTSEVNTAPRTISVIRLGGWFAVVNADAIAAPNDEPMSTLRIKPVMRDSSVATAMEPVARTTSPSLVWVACADFSVDLSSTAGGTGSGFFSSGTGAGGEGATMRWRKPTEEPSASSALPSGEVSLEPPPLFSAGIFAAATAVAAASSSVTEGAVAFDGETGWSCFSAELRDLGLSSTFLLRSEEHTSELQSRGHLVCRLLLESKY